ncbi:hypothetical protein FDECE_18706, partial [Fusarium decemcellulare]
TKSSLGSAASQHTGLDQITTEHSVATTLASSFAPLFSFPSCRVGDREQPGADAMPLHQRTSSSPVKRTSSTTSRSSNSSSKALTGASMSNGRFLPSSPTDCPITVRDYDYEYEYDYESQLRDDLQKANTDLNKANAENDKLKTVIDQLKSKLNEAKSNAEQATRKYNETNVSYRELKAQLEGARSEADVLKEDNRRLN